MKMRGTKKINIFDSFLVQNIEVANNCMDLLEHPQQI